MQAVPNAPQGDRELVQSCYATADLLLAQESIEPLSRSETTMSVPDLRALLAKAVAHGYGQGMIDTKYMVESQLPNGAAIEHGEQVQAVTPGGVKYTPRPYKLWDRICGRLF